MTASCCRPVWWRWSLRCSSGRNWWICIRTVPRSDGIVQGFVITSSSTLLTTCSSQHWCQF